MVKRKDQEKEKQVKISKKTQKPKKEKKTKKSSTTTFKAEFSKIKWPTKKEMIKYSVATIVFVIFFALFFFAIQALMSLLLDLI